MMARKNNFPLLARRDFIKLKTLSLKFTSGEELHVTQAPRFECVTEKYFSYLSTKTYVVGTQKTRLNETVLLSTQNSMPTHISVWGYMYPLVFPFGGTCSFLRVHIF